jgi:hypothetical protein
MKHRKHHRPTRRAPFSSINIPAKIGDREMPMIYFTKG